METNGTTYHNETPIEVINALESCRIMGTRIRIFYGDVITGKAWAEEYDVVGTIGRSTGKNKIPLLINNSRSMGGSPILDHCIVAIKSGNRWLYRHPTLSTGIWRCNHSDLPEYAACVTLDGTIHARFKTFNSAFRYMGFMTGARMCK